MPIRCPHCSNTPLEETSQGLRCPRGHSFDAAKQGYVSLLVGTNRHTGDTVDMIAHRLAAHTQPGYAKMLSQIAVVVGKLVHTQVEHNLPGFIIDAGCGPGDGLAKVIEKLPEGIARDCIGIDTSVFALRRAARAVPESLVIGADLTRKLPFFDNTAMIIMSVFAPKNWREFNRILTPKGRIVSVTPNAGHLATLRSHVPEMLGIPEDKAGELELVARQHGLRELKRLHITHTYQANLGEAIDIVLMGPAAFHTDKRAIIGNVDSAGVPIEIDCSLQIFGRV